MYGCQQNLINPSKELKAILEFICSESHKLTNCGIYYARQLYFKAHKIRVFRHYGVKCSPMLRFGLTPLTPTSHEK